MKKALTLSFLSAVFTLSIFSASFAAGEELNYSFVRLIRNLEKQAYSGGVSEEFPFTLNKTTKDEILKWKKPDLVDSEDFLVYKDDQISFRFDSKTDKLEIIKQSIYSKHTENLYENLKKVLGTPDFDLNLDDKGNLINAEYCMPGQNHTHLRVHNDVTEDDYSFMFTVEFIAAFGHCGT